MPIRHDDLTVTPLPPFPEGWFFVASRETVLKSRAKVIQKTWMGVDVVVWCDDDGRPCVAEAVCPHLGSDLGPDAGGRVRDGRLVCPFHGFEFDATGQCVDTPYAAPPRAARLRVFPAREMLGMIFAWWGIEDREPQWSLPEGVPDQDGWTNVSIRTLRFEGHPQETTENSVDIAHLRYVHGYDGVDRTAPVVVEGPRLESRWDFTSVRDIAKVGSLTMRFSANAQIYGLGYSYVDVHEHTIGMDLRLWVLATPVDGAFIDMSLASQVREIRNPKRKVVGLGFLPRRWRAPLIGRFLAAQQVQDVMQDVIIWSRKSHLSRPRLNRSDGEITTFRAYCAQFYPDAPARLQPTSSGSDGSAAYSDMEAS